MRTMLLTAAAVLAGHLAATTAAAQEQTLLGESADITGYGGLLARGTTFNGTGAVMVGAGGGVIIGHQIVGSFVGYSLATNIDAPMLDTAGRPLRMNFACGGLKVDYILNSDEMLHWSAGALVAGGTISYSHRNWFHNQEQDWEDWDEEKDRDEFGTGTVVVVEPELGAELNITRWFRLGAAVSYRWVSGVDYRGLTSGDLSGVAGGLMLKFGKF